MSHFITRKPSLGYRELRWLGLAFLLHALLLAIPRHEATQGAPDQSPGLLLRLISTPAVISPPEQPRTAVPETAIMLPEQVQPDLPPPIEPQRSELTPQADDWLETPRSRPPVSVTTLMSLRDSVAEQVPAPADAQSRLTDLGAPRPFERPRNWQAGAGAEALAPFDNSFNGKTVPNEVVVVDRWLAGDGSQNVIVETPSGLRMCGRAQAWDPARPLIEPVMMWKVCGGDGARPFEFNPRERPDRDFIVSEPVAKDTTEP